MCLYVRNHGRSHFKPKYRMAPITACYAKTDLHNIFQSFGIWNKYLNIPYISEVIFRCCSRHRNLFQTRNGPGGCAEFGYIHINSNVWEVGSGLRFIQESGSEVFCI